MLVIDEGLAGAVGVGGFTPPSGEDHPGELIWLRRGDKQGIRAVPLSNRELMVVLPFDVAPGLGRPDALRTVYLTLEDDAGVQRQGQRCDASATLSFGCPDEATVLVQSSGDTRLLLVLLRQVRMED